MATMTTVQIPVPKSWDEFETICVALVDRYYRPLGVAQKFGRQGQKQFGLDIVLSGREGLHGFQCKRYETLTLDTVKKELTKLDASDIKLVRLTILTTAPLDAKVQLAVLGLSSDREGGGKCGVEVVYWDTLCSWLAQNPDVFKQFFPEFFPGLAELALALSEKLERELPGVMVDFRDGSSGSSMLVRAKPGTSTTLATLRFTDSEIGDEARRRFHQAVQHGGEVEFSSEEVSVDISKPLGEVLESRLGG